MLLWHLQPTTHLINSEGCDQKLCLRNNGHVQHQLHCPHAWTHRSIQHWLVWTNVWWPWNLHIVRGSDDVGRVNPGHGHSEFFPWTPHMTQSDVIVRSEQAAIVPKDEFLRIKFRPNLETKQMHRFEVSAHTVNIINLYAVSGKLDTYVADHVCVVHTSLLACLLVYWLLLGGTMQATVTRSSGTEVMSTNWGHTQ